MIPVGTMVLNENVTNFFNETEVLAVDPGITVPGNLIVSAPHCLAAWLLLGVYVYITRRSSCTMLGLSYTNTWWLLLYYTWLLLYSTRLLLYYTWLLYCYTWLLYYYTWLPLILHSSSGPCPAPPVFFTSCPRSCATAQRSHIAVLHSTGGGVLHYFFCGLWYLFCGSWYFFCRLWYFSCGLRYLFFGLWSLFCEKLVLVNAHGRWKLGLSVVEANGREIGC